MTDSYNVFIKHTAVCTRSLHNGLDALQLMNWRKNGKTWEMPLCGLEGSIIKKLEVELVPQAILHGHIGWRCCGWSHISLEAGENSHYIYHYSLKNVTAWSSHILGCLQTCLQLIESLWHYCDNHTMILGYSINCLFVHTCRTETNLLVPCTSLPESSEPPSNHRNKVLPQARKAHHHHHPLH